MSAHLDDSHVWSNDVSQDLLWVWKIICLKKRHKWQTFHPEMGQTVSCCFDFSPPCHWKKVQWASTEATISQGFNKTLLSSPNWACMWWWFFVPQPACPTDHLIRSSFLPHHPVGLKADLRVKSDMLAFRPRKRNITGKMAASILCRKWAFSSELHPKTWEHHLRPSEHHSKRKWEHDLFGLGLEQWWVNRLRLWVTDQIVVGQKPEESDQ